MKKYKIGEYFLWAAFITISTILIIVTLTACTFNIPYFGKVLSNCPQTILIPYEQLMQNETHELISKLKDLEMHVKRVDVCPPVDKEKLLEISRLKENIDSSGKVTSRNVIITVHDHNMAFDDYFDLYVNTEFVAHIRNKPGGKSSYEILLTKGENIIQLKPVKDNGNGTELNISIEPGEFSRNFVGFQEHIYMIDAP